MLEIITLLVLTGIIGDMARRRGRSSNFFGLMLIACWLGGELAGGLLGYVLSVAAGRPEPNLLLIYVPALGGAICGTVVAFVVAKSLAPVDGEWKDLAENPVRRSRLLGAVVGGVGGGAAGAAVIWFMYGNQSNEGNLHVVLQGFLAVGLVGALLGLVSGLQQD